ncbi:MAG TPA: VWA domain-containing protein [Candidatus Angelobacter sp.]|nr:VWA domain-containing protein [Candidatus Angelobacter sp.]
MNWQSSVAKLISFLPLFCGCVFAQNQANQIGDQGVYRVDVRLVTVDTQVLEKKSGHAVSGLTARDFQIYEDNRQQQINSFSQDELPLSVVLLFDLTDSVRPVLKPLSEGALDALQHLKPQDEVAVMTYSATAQLLQDFTTDRALAVQAIEKASRMKSAEAAFFNEGIYQAAARLQKSGNRLNRRVIIWFTDDIPNFPSDEVKARYGRSLAKKKLHTEKDATQELLQTGTVVCTLLETSQISDDQFSLRLSKAGETMLNNLRYPPGEVHKYARATGGQVVQTSHKRIDRRLASLIDDIRKLYTLGYHPAERQPKGKFCKIQVKLSPEAKRAHEDAIVTAREGYYR